LPEISPLIIDSRFTPFVLSVRSSRIDRRGVFAEVTIPARRKVVEYAGEKVTMRTAISRVRRILFAKGVARSSQRVYMAQLNRRYAIDGSVGGSGAEFINHSCDPNLYARKSSGRIDLFSKRLIRKGQELTLDYRFGPSSMPMACHCGSRKCRGTINPRK
jgi:SET domain-containing protein